MRDPQLGELCFLCDLDGNASVITPRDSYSRNVYLQPLGLYLQAEAGQIAFVVRTRAWTYKQENIEETVLRLLRA